MYLEKEGVMRQGLIRGGFFICCAFLMCGCVGGELEEEGFVVVVSFTGDKTTGDKTEIVDDVDDEESIPGIGSVIEREGFGYRNNNLSIDFVFPEDWRILEPLVLEGEGLSLLLSNFDFDDGLHPLVGEILVELFRFDRGGSSLQDFVIELERDFDRSNAVFVDFDEGDDFVWFWWKLNDVPENWQGGWFPRYVWRYYIANGEAVYLFSAVVNLVDRDLLRDFKSLISTVRFEDTSGRLSFRSADLASPIELWCPWPVGQRWMVGGMGSYYGEGYHRGIHYYCVDMNWVDGDDMGQNILAAAD